MYSGRLFRGPSSKFSLPFQNFMFRYSEASRKCSNEGLALMRLDSESLCRDIEKITGLCPLPHRPYLENYIKAFFLPPNELDKWISYHAEYRYCLNFPRIPYHHCCTFFSISQTTSLLNFGSSPAKRVKSRLLNILESP